MKSKLSCAIGKGSTSYSGDGGSATAAAFNNPDRIWIDSTGYFCLGDSCKYLLMYLYGLTSYLYCAANRVIRAINSLGIISTIIGNGDISYNGENLPATQAAISSPDGISVDQSNGDIYFGDENDVVQVLTRTTNTVSTFAGNRNLGYAGDDGLATSASLNGPKGIYLDTSNRLFIADYLNNVVRMVYSVSPTSSPTPSPTIIPTTAPSVSPSVLPSANPSVVPTIGPSCLPSVLPSVVPSIIPSRIPTVLPSQMPSASPSNGPTNAPSMLPSVLPSTSPSCSPSLIPSIAPSISFVPSVSNPPSISPTRVRSTMNFIDKVYLDSSVIVPRGLSGDTVGIIYVAEESNSCVRKFSSSLLTLSTFAGIC